MSDASSSAVAARRLVPVVVVDRRRDARCRSAAALAAGGLPVGRGHLPHARPRSARSGAWPPSPDFVVGAGTVLRPEQVDAGRRRRARGSSSRPASAPRWSRAAATLGVPVLPGRGDRDRDAWPRSTHGLDVVKFFPAEQLGRRRRWSRRSPAPFRDVRFVPTGGIGPPNAGRLPRAAVRARGRRHLDGRARSSSRRGDFDAIARLDRAAAVALGAEAAMTPLAIRPADECRYDVVVARRGDAAPRPRRGPHPHRPHVPGLGGRRRVQRGPRPAPLLRPAHRGRHRACRQRGRPAGRGPDPAGRRRHVARSAGCPYDGVGRDRPQRAQLHRARLRRARRGRRLRPRPHRGVASCARATSTGSTCSATLACAGSTPAASSPRSPRRRRDVVEEAMEAARAARHDRLVRPQLPARACGRRSAAASPRAGGQPRAAPARRRDDRQRGGLHRLPRLRGRGRRRAPDRARRRRASRR